MAGGAEGYGEPAPGDHLQTWYRLWLPGDQLEHGRAPWRDEYSFRPESDPIVNLGGWPYSLVYWPLHELFGVIVAWNLFVLITFVLAGVVTLLWLLELGLPRWAALAGALAFAIAPYRTVQSEGHLLGPISILLPLSLWAFERERRGSRWWLLLSGAAIASIPLSGQVHLALGAIPFFLVYAVCRTRDRSAVIGAALGAVAAVLAGVLVRETLIKGSTEAGGRKLAEVTRYSANVGDFLSRHVGQGRSEQFVFLGWVTPLVALLGLVLLLRARRYALAAVLAVGVVVPVVLALGTNTSIYSAVWHALPPFRFPRVPERLLPIACLCIAALFAFAVAGARRGWVTALAIAVVFVDLHARVYHSSAAGDPEAVAFRGPGRLLELPVFDPSVHLGSVYLWYDTASQRRRPGGYSTTAPEAAKRTADLLERLNCGDWSGDTARELDRLGVRSITLHGGLYDRNRAVVPTDWFASQGLRSHGWNVQRASGPVSLFERRPPAFSFARAEPPRSQPIFCQGWYGDTGSGRYMSERHAPFWIYGNGTPRLRFAPSRLPRRVRVQRLEGGRWQLVTVDVPTLGRVPGVRNRVGLRLLEVTLR